MCFVLTAAIMPWMSAHMRCAVAYAGMWILNRFHLAAHGADCRMSTVLVFTVYCRTGTPLPWTDVLGFAGFLLICPDCFLWWPRAKKGSMAAAKRPRDRHTLSANEITHKRLAVSETASWKPTRGILTNLNDEKTACAAVTELLNKKMISARTTGDGACAIHALLGRPLADGSLFCENARDIVTESFEAAFHSSDTHKRKLLTIIDCMWTELTEAKKKRRSVAERGKHHLGSAK